jgi:hypothetical protein
MLMRCVVFVFLLMVFVPVSAKDAPTPAPNITVKADAQRTTSTGTQFVVPADWTIHTHGNKITLSPPESGSQVVLVDVKAADVDAAVAAAWKIYGSARTWPLQVATDSSPRDNWDQIKVYRYETSANDKRDVKALA